VLHPNNSFKPKPLRGSLYSSVICQREIVVNRLVFCILAISTFFLSSCAKESSPQGEPVAATAATPQPPSGERLVYVVGCVNCHHQTPKEIFNAPPLTVVQGYSLPELKKLLTTGVTRGGRDMYAQGSIMGIVAREQLSHLTDEEMVAIHQFLQKGWTAERGAQEEAKIATFPPPTFMQK
jgi:cytochrome c553